MLLSENGYKGQVFEDTSLGMYFRPLNKLIAGHGDYQEHSLRSTLLVRPNSHLHLFLGSS